MTEDDRYWRYVQEAAAEVGWGLRSVVLQRAHINLIKAGYGNGDAYRTLERLWKQRADVKDSI